MIRHRKEEPILAKGNDVMKTFKILVLPILLLVLGFLACREFKIVNGVLSNFGTFKECHTISQLDQNSKPHVHESGDAIEKRASGESGPSASELFPDEFDERFRFLANRRTENAVSGKVAVRLPVEKAGPDLEKAPFKAGNKDAGIPGAVSASPKIEKHVDFDVAISKGPESESSTDNPKGNRSEPRKEGVDLEKVRQILVLYLMVFQELEKEKKEKSE